MCEGKGMNIYIIRCFFFRNHEPKKCRATCIWTCPWNLLSLLSNIIRKNGSMWSKEQVGWLTRAQLQESQNYSPGVGFLWRTTYFLLVSVYKACQKVMATNNPACRNGRVGWQISQTWVERKAKYIVHGGDRKHISNSREKFAQRALPRIFGRV